MPVLLSLALPACEPAESGAPAGLPTGTSRGISPQPIPIPTSEARIDITSITLQADASGTVVVGGPNAVTQGAHVFAWDLESRTSAMGTVGQDGQFTLSLAGAPAHAFRLVALVESFTAVADVVAGPDGRATARVFDACLAGGNSHLANVFGADAPVGETREVSTTFANTCARDVIARVDWISGPVFAGRGGSELPISTGGEQPFTLALRPRESGFAVELLLLRVDGVLVPVTLIGLGLTG
jgi:hypothetical protein